MEVPHVLSYKVGDKTESGETITFIYGHSPQVIVYKDGNGHIQWEIAADILTQTESAVHQHYDRLDARIRACLSEKKLQLLTDELAKALFLALSEPDAEKALRCFDAVAGEFAQEAQIQARFKYIIAGSVTAAGTLLAGTVASFIVGDANVDTLPIGAMSGAVGAWASILQRASRLELGPFETPAHLSFQGLTRILIGATFGIVAIVAIKAGLLLSAATESLWTTCITTFVAGFSERLIPELITRLESREATTALTSSRSRAG